MVDSHIHQPERIIKFDDVKSQRKIKDTTRVERKAELKLHVKFVNNFNKAYKILNSLHLARRVLDRFCNHYFTRTKRI